ncbi:hypothetical protein B0H14DRAFT_2565054 [Mycena olivaceomarginata]|nr:hypothetical protein B0H14DRAFT_2565054 [Mycena olivaceomarginata]
MEYSQWYRNVYRPLLDSTPGPPRQMRWVPMGVHVRYPGWAQQKNKNGSQKASGVKGCVISGSWQAFPRPPTPPEKEIVWPGQIAAITASSHGRQHIVLLYSMLAAAQCCNLAA